jgi:hypothetical protein
MPPIPFDPADPYPNPGPSTYADAQAHSAQVDAWLGIDTHAIEASLQKSRHPGQQLWIGLPVQAMLTPYTELREMLAHLAPSPGQAVVDLGAGYGRMGFVVARHHPGVRFVGYEFVAERVAAGQAALRSQGATPASGIELRRRDLASARFAPLPADFYLIYDYGTREAIQKTLEDLRGIAQSRRVTVIGRGRASRDAIEREHPWLSQVNPPEHRGHYSVYRT